MFLLWFLRHQDPFMPKVMAASLLSKVSTTQGRDTQGRSLEHGPVVDQSWLRAINSRAGDTMRKRSLWGLVGYLNKGIKGLPDVHFPLRSSAMTGGPKTYELVIIVGKPN